MDSGLSNIRSGDLVKCNSSEFEEAIKDMSLEEKIGLFVLLCFGRVFMGQQHLIGHIAAKMV